ncbi:MAG: hypothetical protein QOE15_829 [Acidimicrobiaceae bacterium]|jgi:hypothetical protein|nr:hypothetical protein [Acidimicrobiaceae bacterium]
MLAPGMSGVSGPVQAGSVSPSTSDGPPTSSSDGGGGPRGLNDRPDRAQRVTVVGDMAKKRSGVTSPPEPVLPCWLSGTFSILGPLLYLAL